MTRSFDAVADLYREEFAGELTAKPFDRALLDGFARDVLAAPVNGPVLEVGAGPGHIGAYLAAHGVTVVVSDGSPGQLAQARGVRTDAALVGTDLALLPVRPGSLAGIVAFYCLIYGPPDPIDAVLSDWHRALAPGGRVVIAVQAGDGELTRREWKGHAIEVTVVLRDPDDLTRRLTQAGFTIERAETRPPYADEHTDRCYLVARR